MFAPPFRDPFNYNFDPLVADRDRHGRRGDATHRMVTEKASPASRCARGQLYSTWWNGGLRTTAYFHNIIGLLTETIGNPTPMTIPFDRRRSSCRESDLPCPIEPQAWHFRQSIDYSVTANRAVLDLASREQGELPLQHLPDGQELDRARAAATAGRLTPQPRCWRLKRRVAGEAGGRGGGGRGDASAADDGSSRAGTRERVRQTCCAIPHSAIRAASSSPSDQPDFPTATKFINTLRQDRHHGHRATAAFTVDGKNYPAGSYVVKTAQAFRPHVLDMFEPQDHPDDIAVSRAGRRRRPTTTPGWTLAFQMGVQFDRVLDDFNGPFERVTDLQKPAPGKVSGTGTAGYLLTPRDQRRVHGRQPAAGGRRGRLVRSMSAASGPGRVLRRAAGRRRTPLVDKLAADSASAFERRRRARRSDRRQKLAKLRIAWRTATAGRCRRAGPASCSSSSSSRSRSSFRRRSTPAISRAGTTCIDLSERPRFRPVAAVAAAEVAVEAADAAAAVPRVEHSGRVSAISSASITDRRDHGARS